jgi:hypothetical protein
MTIYNVDPLPALRANDRQRTSSSVEQHSTRPTPQDGQRHKFVSTSPLEPIVQPWRFTVFRITSMLHHHGMMWGLTIGADGLYNPCESQSLFRPIILFMLYMEQLPDKERPCEVIDVIHFRCIITLREGTLDSTRVTEQYGS